MDKLYTIAEVATKLNLSDKTLRRWEEAGRFSSTRTLGNQRRYCLEDLQILDAIKHGTIESQKDLLTPAQAANLCGVSLASLTRWENDGKIHPFITAAGTYYPRHRLIEKMDELKKTYVESVPELYTPGVKGSHTPGVGTGVGTVPERNPRLPSTPGVKGSHTPGVLPPPETRVFISQVLITLILLLSYHLLFASSSTTPVSPAPQVQGAATTPDPRLDDLITKFQSHLANDLLGQAKPIQPITIQLANTDLVYGTATIPKGQDQFTVTESMVSPDTPITLTFTADYAPAKKYWVTTAPGAFTLHTDFPLAQDASFTYGLIPLTSATPPASASAQTDSTL